MASFLLKNAHLPNGEQTEILIENGLIARIGPSVGETSGPIIDACGQYVVPGYYNMHTHSAMTLVRGYRDDMELFNWLKSIRAVEAHLDEDAIYWGTRLASLEMIKSGTVFFSDMYFLLDSSAQAIADSGIKALLTSCFLDGGKEHKKLQDRRDCERDFMISQKWPGSVRFGVSVHAPYTVCEENILWAAAFARERGLPITIHVSETESENKEFSATHGVSPVRHLEKLKFWGDDVMVAHGLHLSDEDIKILGEHHVTVAHCINSNLKLASGHAFRYEELRDAGVNVVLGTDGCASSNNLDIQEAMKTSSLLQKGWRRESTSLPLNEVMVMATANGARAMKVNGGKIEAGALADLLLVDTHSAAFTPNINFLSNLIYASNSSCIDTVICQGDIVMEHRKVKDEDLILEQAAEHSARLVSKAQGNK